jgi:Protein of unknown function (DUF3311)
MQRRLRFLLAAIPFGALSVAVPFVNFVEPRILGLPFLLAWIAFWVIVTPAFIWALGRSEGHW